MAALGEIEGVADGLGTATVQLPHLRGLFEMALGIGKTELAQVLDREAVTDGGEHILKRLASRVVIVYVIGGDERQTGFLGEMQEALEHALVVVAQMK